MLVPNGGVTGGDGASISGRPHELQDGDAGAFHVRMLGAKGDEIDRADDHRFVGGLRRGEMNSPAGPRTNEVFVADGYGNRRVIVFDAGTGAYKRHWGAYGNKPDGLNWLKSRQMSHPRRQTKKEQQQMRKQRFLLALSRCEPSIASPWLSVNDGRATNDPPWPQGLLPSKCTGPAMRL
jgi:hypothetical protein